MNSNDRIEAIRLTAIFIGVFALISLFAFLTPGFYTSALESIMRADPGLNLMVASPTEPFQSNALISGTIGTVISTTLVIVVGLLRGSFGLRDRESYLFVAILGFLATLILFAVGLFLLPAVNFLSGLGSPVSGSQVALLDFVQWKYNTSTWSALLLSLPLYIVAVALFLNRAHRGASSK